jgi:hypothetical protein
VNRSTATFTSTTHRFRGDVEISVGNYRLCEAGEESDDKDESLSKEEPELAWLLADRLREYRDHPKITSNRCKLYQLQRPTI